MGMRKQKQSIIDDEERMLKYLLSKDRDKNNTVTIGTKRYSEIKGMDPEQFVQTLCALEDRQYVDLDFAGPRSYTSLCYVTIKEPGLTYFEDQDIQEHEDKEKKRHDYCVSLYGAIISSIITAILGFILGKLTG